MLKKFLFIVLSFSFACENMKISSQTQEKISKVPDSVSEPEIINETTTAFVSENSFVEYHNKTNNYLKSGFSFVSYSKDLSIIIEKNLENNFDINLYKNENEKWINTGQTVATYSEVVAIKKAKNSNRFIVIKLNGSSTIDLYDLENSYVESFDVENVYINQVEISEDGKRIFYRKTNSLNTLYLIDEVADKTWENVKFGESIEKSSIFKTKYSKDSVLIHYWDLDFVPHFDLFKIENDYSLTKVLDLSEEMSSISLDYLRDVTLSDNVLSYRLKDSLGVEVVTYVKDIYTSQWYKTDNIDVVFSSEFNTLNSIFLDSFDDTLVINYYDVDNKEIVSIFYDFNYNLNNWEIVQQNLIENVEVLGEISFWERVTYDVNENALDIIVDVQDFENGIHEFRGFSFQIIYEVNNYDLTILDTFDRNYNSLDVNFASLSGGRALMIDKEDDLYNLNLYKSINGAWLKQKTIYSNESFLTLRKAKNSDTFITYFQTIENNIINIYEPNLDSITPIEVGKIYTSSSNKPLISSDGNRIIFCNLSDQGLETLKIINKELDGTYTINEISGPSIKMALNLKFSKNYLVLRYLDPNFNYHFILYKINEDYSLSEELVINEDDFAIGNQNLNRDMVLSDTMFAYTSSITESLATVTIYKKDANSWNESGSVEVFGWYLVNRYLDYFNDSFVFHGFDVSADDHHKIKTVLFNFTNGQWQETKSNTFIIEGGFSSPLNYERLSYSLNEDALDACMLIKSENVSGVLYFKNKCFSDRSFLK